MSLSDGIQMGFLLSFVVSFLLTPLVRRFGYDFRLLDVPNARSSHAVPTPRTGGIAILLGVIAGVAVAGSLATSPACALLLGAVTLGAVSLYDDRRTLPRHSRLVAQIVVALGALYATGLAVQPMELPLIGTIDSAIVPVALAVVWIVGVTNAYNFMDGINGIASLEAVICSVTLGILLASGGDLRGAVIAIAIAGAAGGFLAWNLGGSIFMGDVGSAGLGFLLSLLVLRTSKVAPSIAAVLPLVPFLFDAGVTLVTRAVRGERFFSTPHRSHFYQRLVASGLTHVTVSSIYAALALLCALLALVYSQLSGGQRALGILILILLHAGVAAATFQLESQRKTPG